MQLCSDFHLLFHSALVQAAFSTRLESDTEINDNAVIFGHVNLNIGNGYDEFTGKKMFKNIN